MNPKGPLRKTALVVARHKEDIRWMSYLGRRPDWDVHVFNDGPALDPFFSSGFNQYIGDKVPAEASKYLRFIVDNYNRLESDFDWVVFMQADPFVHSPDFVGLLEQRNAWQEPFQGLTYGAHPPPWGPVCRLDKHKKIGGMRVWCEETMDDSWQGLWKDPFLKKNPLKPVSKIFEHCGARKGDMKKWYCAIFAVKPKAIVAQKLDTWQCLLQNSIEGGKQYAYNMEYAWCPLLSTRS